MQDKNLCPKIKKCPLFNNKLLKRKDSEEIYKTLYCKAGKEKYMTCRRYIISEKYGVCPEIVLPNSTRTNEEIEQYMKENGML